MINETIELLENVSNTPINIIDDSMLFSSNMFLIKRLFFSFKAMKNPKIRIKPKRWDPIRPFKLYTSKL